MESNMLRLVTVSLLNSAWLSVYSGGGASSERSGNPSRSSGNRIMNRSRNLLRAASVAPIDPSVEFFMMDHVKPKASHIGTRNLGNCPSNKMYHLAGVNIAHEGGTTCHWQVRDACARDVVFKCRRDIRR